MVDDTPWVPRGHSRERTFPQNLTSRAQIDEAVGELAGEAFEDCAAENRPVVRVHLKVRYAPFETRTMSRKLSEPTTRSETFVDATLALGAGIADDREVRLLGIRAEMAMPDDEARAEAEAVARETE